MSYDLLKTSMRYRTYKPSNPKKKLKYNPLKKYCLLFTKNKIKLCFFWADCAYPCLCT